MAPRLPPNWNRSKLNHGPDDASYSFLYAHGAGDTTYRIKIDKMGRNVEIRGVNSTDEDNIIRLEITIKDHVDPSSFPIITSADDGAENRASAESLKGIFIQLDGQSYANSCHNKFPFLPDYADRSSAHSSLQNQYDRKTPGRFQSRKRPWRP